MKLVDSPHPAEERLVLRYFRPTGGDEELELHLLRCPACAERAGDLAARLDADHDVTLAAADAAFGAERLERQRASILTRLARRQVAPVVALGSFSPTVAHVATHSRWTAAAAVLVFSVSLGSGSWFGGAWSRSGDPVPDAPLQASLAPLNEREDALLLEIERAIAQPHTRELRALEALTPRAGEPVEF